MELSICDYKLAYNRQTRQTLYDLGEMMANVLNVCRQDDALCLIDELEAHGLVEIFEYDDVLLYMLTGNFDSYPKTDGEKC